MNLVYACVFAFCYVGPDMPATCNLGMIRILEGTEQEVDRRMTIWQRALWESVDRDRRHNYSVTWQCRPLKDVKT